jgi:hypothetical protein
MSTLQMRGIAIVSPSARHLRPDGDKDCSFAVR